MISAKVVADSISPKGKRITTLALEYPRFIHSEFMTHRIFSRNASSSRAIPVRKMIARVIRNPAVPIHWGSNRPGMQATEELAGWRRWVVRQLWLLARWPAIVFAYLAMWLGLHKQVANRILEPWMHISVLVTSTEWGNFFNLRYHPDAQPEIRELAIRMFEAMKASKPRYLRIIKGTALNGRPVEDCEWHLPYITDEERQRLDVETMLKVSAARCARVSYLTHEGKVPTLAEDLALFDRLMKGTPKHASPTEHQARPVMSLADFHLCGNFEGYVQFRKTIPGEYLPEFTRP